MVVRSSEPSIDGLSHRRPHEPPTGRAELPTTTDSPNYHQQSELPSTVRTTVDSPNYNRQSELPPTVRTTTDSPNYHRQSVQRGRVRLGDDLLQFPSRLFHRRHLVLQH